MKTLHITVADKTATYRERDGEIVCGNSDYEIEFAFDAEWSSHTFKTARFIYNGVHKDVAFSGNTCSVPILRGTTSVSVGVYAGDLTTTTPAVIGCKKSILCDSSFPDDPEDESVYTQILESMDEIAKEFMPNYENDTNERQMLMWKKISKTFSRITANYGVVSEDSIPIRQKAFDGSAHPGTFEVSHPVMTEGEAGYSAKHPMTVGTAEERYVKQSDTDLLAQYTIEPNCTIDNINTNYKDSFPVNCFNRTPVVGDIFLVTGRTVQDKIAFNLTARVTGFTEANGIKYAQFEVIEAVPMTNAVNATKDGDGNIIAETYAKKSEPNAILYGDGTYGLKYQFTGSSYEVAKNDTANVSGDVVIASSIIHIPVTSIVEQAFYGCDSLTSVTIPDSVTSIGYQTFAYCDSLTSVMIGNGVTEINEQAFYACPLLSSVTLGTNVKDIYPQAFVSCSKLTSIRIPKSVTYISSTAFGGGAMTVYYEGTQDEWNAIVTSSSHCLANATIHYNS